jgi:hypothetical protein
MSPSILELLLLLLALGAATPQEELVKAVESLKAERQLKGLQLQLTENR